MSRGMGSRTGGCVSNGTSETRGPEGGFVQRMGTRRRSGDPPESLSPVVK